MRHIARRRIAVGVVAFATGILAVACSGGAPGLPSPVVPGPMQIAGFSIKLPPLTARFDQATIGQPAMPTQAQANAAASVHSNPEGCPLALPAN